MCIPQRALAAIGDDNNRFLLRRVHVWPNTFLLQQVRAPVLKNRPVFGDAAFQWDRVAIRAFETPSTWVDLGATFTALGVDYPRGDALKIHQMSISLSVHPLWMLAIGIVGRFSLRRDGGRFGSVKFSSSVKLPKVRDYEDFSQRQRLREGSVSSQLIVKK